MRRRGRRQMVGTGAAHPVVSGALELGREGCVAHHARDEIEGERQNRVSGAANRLAETGIGVAPPRQTGQDVVEAALGCPIEALPQRRHRRLDLADRLWRRLRLGEQQVEADHLWPRRRDPVEKQDLPRPGPAADLGDAGVVDLDDHHRDVAARRRAQANPQIEPARRRCRRGSTRRICAR
jgi:hypothetical protein